MEHMNLTIIENIEFEEKVDIDDLVLPSKPMKMAVIEINDIKQEPIEEKNKQNAFQLDHDEGKKFSVYFLLFPYPKKVSHFFSSHWKK